MKKSASSSTVKLREPKMKAALQLIQLTSDSCSSRDDVYVEHSASNKSRVVSRLSQRRRDGAHRGASMEALEDSE